MSEEITQAEQAAWHAGLDEGRRQQREGGEYRILIHGFSRTFSLEKYKSPEQAKEAAFAHAAKHGVCVDVVRCVGGMVPGDRPVTWRGE